MEKTLIIFKPDSLEKKCVGDVLSRFERAGLEMCGAKMLCLERSLLKDHYSHISHLPCFPKVVEFMSSRAVLIIVLQGKNAIERVRDLLGPTDSSSAPAGTIRGDFGSDNRRNICHASDCPKSALLEISRFFKEEELF
jgi:nucleoside-diphosphate kinase